jgi:hypothetical protein
LWKGEGGPFAYAWFSVALACFGLEMGGYFHGFYCGIAPLAKGYDSIWVIIDRLTKSAHFLPVDTRYTATEYAKLYFDRIVTLHGVCLTIVSDRGLVFMAHF